MSFLRGTRPVSLGARRHVQFQSSMLRTWMEVVLAITCAVALVIAFALAPGSKASAASGDSNVRVKAYYLALGTSLAYGEQPIGQPYDQGYAQQWFTLLHEQGSRSLTDYGCPGVTSDGFITKNGCDWVPSGGTDVLHAHDFYGTPQLDAAVSFIEAHPNQVSPVSLDIGSNDLVQALLNGGIYFDATGCHVVDSVARGAIAHVQANLTQTILPELVQALTGPGGQRTGDLVLMNLYDPYQNVCPATVPYLQDFNQMLTTAAAQVHVPVVDVFDAFGGSAVPNPYIYGGTYNGITYPTYTWMAIGNIHPTTVGYGVIAAAFNRLVDDN